MNWGRGQAARWLGLHCPDLVQDLAGLGVAFLAAGRGPGSGAGEVRDTAAPLLRNRSWAALWAGVIPGAGRGVDEDQQDREFLQ